jgi:hypothetical protein
MDEPIKAVPAPADNAAEPETPAPVIDNAELSQKIAALEVKVAEQARHLTASKAEALRLKDQNERYQQPAPDSPQVSNEDVELFKTYAKAAGIPFRDDIESLKKDQYVETQRQVVDKFLDEFPQYKPENDKDDSQWGKIQAELGLYKNPQNPKEWYALLKRAHSSIQPDNSFQKGKALGHAEANLQEQTKLGGGSPGAKAPTQKLSPEKQAIQEGFSSLRPQYF